MLWPFYQSDMVPKCLKPAIASSQKGFNITESLLNSLKKTSSYFYLIQDALFIWSNFYRNTLHQRWGCEPLGCNYSGRLLSITIIANIKIIKINLPGSCRRIVYWTKISSYLWNKKNRTLHFPTNKFYLSWSIAIHDIWGGW